MIVFGGIKRLKGNYFGYNWIFVNLVFFKLSDDFIDNIFLFLITVENNRTVLSADIGSLTV